MSDVLRSAREVAAKMEASGHNLKGRTNVYACTPNLMEPDAKSGCGYWIVTVDRDTGVTPMFVKCGHCDGMATSRMYRVGDGLEPTHEWFRPDSVDDIPPEYRGPGGMDHLNNGGLLLRPISDGRWLEPTPVTRAFVEREMAMLRSMGMGKALRQEREDPPALMNRQQRRHHARKGGQINE